MSRSSRKYYIIQQGGYKKRAKCWANKRVIKYPNLENGCIYKKVYENWDIDDFGQYCGLKSAYFPTAKRKQEQYMTKKVKPNAIVIDVDGTLGCGQKPHNYLLCAKK